MNSKDLAIGTLTVTATILLVALLLVGLERPQAAYGLGMNAAGTDYVVTTAQMDDTTELLYVLDVNAEQMNVYGFNLIAGRLDLIRSLDVRWRPGPGRDAERGRR